MSHQDLPAPGGSSTALLDTSAQRTRSSDVRSALSTPPPFEPPRPLRSRDAVFRRLLTRVAAVFDACASWVRRVGIGDLHRDEERAREAERPFPLPFESSPVETESPDGAPLVGSAVDMSERKRADSEHQRMAALVESADDAIITKGLDGTILSWNPGATRLLGYTARESVGRPITMLIPEHRLDEETRILEQVKSGNYVRHFETVRRRKDGSLVEVSISVSPVHDRSGTIVAAAKIMRDMTARNEAAVERVQLVEQLKTLNAALEERVRSRTSELSQTLRERETLLREKTSLLQEVHHRVKNNLQMVSSLLNLQAKQIEDEDARAIFLDTQGRVRSIALLHESLYQSHDLGRVEMRPYVDKLVNTMKRASGQSAFGVTFVTSIDRVDLPVDAAVPCGLIVNELVTNALKHAFVDARDGAHNEICVEIRRAGGDMTLLVADNGPGFAGMVDPSRAETMGLTLVRDLSVQLGGNAEFASAGGVRCAVRFPVPTQKIGSPS